MGRVRRASQGVLLVQPSSKTIHYHVPSAVGVGVCDPGAGGCLPRGLRIQANRAKSWPVTVSSGGRSLGCCRGQCQLGHDIWRGRNRAPPHTHTPCSSLEHFCSPPPPPDARRGTRPGAQAPLPARPGPAGTRGPRLAHPRRSPGSLTGQDRAGGVVRCMQSGHPGRQGRAGPFPSSPRSALPRHRQHLPISPLSSLHRSAVDWSARRWSPGLQRASYGKERRL